MGIFTPGMFGRMFGRREAPKEDAAPVTPSVECDVCHGGHDREACPSIVTAATLWKTWRSSGPPDGSLRGGDTFDLIADFYARFRGE